ncbi:hypothetical protein GCM10015535_67480 [Streptomyces gelaticus]|uniref:Uncharacterized protein n=1 Tax=Streptomyces gelaticus TaxID=285446 RepID=A0ABQ2WC88_9ACTN|nr:hypothetical protein GCM10015535_67480 [Streptomyces gelaticus]
MGKRPTARHQSEEMDEEPWPDMEFRARGFHVRVDKFPWKGLASSRARSPLPGWPAFTSGCSDPAEGLALRGVRSDRRADPGAPSCQGAHAPRYGQQQLAARTVAAFGTDSQGPRCAHPGVRFSR